MQKPTDCRRHRHIRVDAAHPGYISTSEDTSIGNRGFNCQWRIQALPGQKVNITLYDFSVFSTTRDRATAKGGSPLCYFKIYF